MKEFKGTVKEYEQETDYHGDVVAWIIISTYKKIYVYLYMYIYILVISSILLCYFHSIILCKHMLCKNNPDAVVDLEVGSLASHKWKEKINTHYY